VVIEMHVRLREVAADELLSYAGLLPFAVLGQSAEPVQTLRQAVGEILKISDEVQQHEAMAAAYVLAGLRCEEAVITEVIRRDVMQESVTYQAILREGRQEATLSLVIRLLIRRFGELPEDAGVTIAALPLPALEALSEALLDFTSLNDLERWLTEQS
jgi:predicted transposase YdaD